MKRVCIYCGVIGACEAEHVFPKSWYPDTTPRGVQRLTVPACRGCNKRWQVLEDTFAQDMLMGISPFAPEVAGVHARLTRGWQAATGKTPKERRIRAGNALRILRTMQWVEPGPGQPTAVLRTRGGLLVRFSPARRIEPQLRQALAEKLVRGLHYHETGEILREVRVHRTFLVLDEWVEDVELVDVWQALRQLPINDSLGPGFWYRRHVEGERSLWAFRIWGQITMVAAAELQRLACAPEASVPSWQD